MITITMCDFFTGAHIPIFFKLRLKNSDNLYLYILNTNFSSRHKLHLPCKLLIDNFMVAHELMKVC